MTRTVGCHAGLQPGAQRLVRIDPNEEETFGSRGLHIFAHGIRRGSIFADQPNFEGHARFGSAGAQAVDDRFIEDAEAAGDAVAGNQRQPARNGFGSGA